MKLSEILLRAPSPDPAETVCVMCDGRIVTGDGIFRAAYRHDDGRIDHCVTCLSCGEKIHASEDMQHQFKAKLAARFEPAAGAA